MKNKRLQEKLNIYADNIKLKEDILYGAYREMDFKRNSFAYGKRARRRGLGFAAWAGLFAAAVFMIVVFGVLINNLIPFKSPAVAPYLLSSLQKEAVTQDEFLRFSNVMFLTGEEGQIDGRFYIYVDEENQIYTAKAIYRVIRNGCVDEVTIVSDFKNGLTDYESWKPAKNDIKRDYDKEDKGEYYSYLSKSDGKSTYYVIIISPLPLAGQYYENII